MAYGTNTQVHRRCKIVTKFAIRSYSGQDEANFYHEPLEDPI